MKENVLKLENKIDGLAKVFDNVTKKYIRDEFDIIKSLLKIIKKESEELDYSKIDLRKKSLEISQTIGSNDVSILLNSAESIHNYLLDK